MAQIAVIGLGHFGFAVTSALHDAGHEVLAIDIDPESVQKVRDHCTRAVLLDARDRQRLEALGIRDAEVVVVSLGGLIDVSSLVALHLREIGVRRIITKAGSEDHGKLLRLIGVDEVLFPERETALRLAHRLGNANVLDFVPLGESWGVHEIAPPTAFCGKTIRELDVRKRFGVQVLATRDALTQAMNINPPADFVIKESDVLVILARDDHVDRLRKLR